MIAPMQSKRSQVLEQQHHEQFLKMLSQIRSQARIAFRQLRPEQQEELIQEVIANAFCAFVSLVCRGKANLAYATPLASFAIRQTLAGRRVGAKTSILDVLSPAARSVRGIIVESLDNYDYEQGDLRAALLEDRRATPAEIAAARIDMAAWFRSLDLRNHRIAMALAMGDSTGEVARRFGLSAARISQIRELLRASWEQFQRGDPVCGPS